MNQRKTIAWALVTCSAFLLLLTALLPTASGQSMTGQVSGTVQDPQSAVIPGATVTLTSELTGQERQMASGSQGEFLFTQLVAGAYTVRVSASGFKVFEQKGIKLSANEKMVVSSVKLEIGTTSETVEVTASVARVETQSSERTGLISSTQVSELAASADRDYMKLLKVVPGVVFNADQPLNNAGGPPPPGPSYTVLGGKSGQTIVSLDGIADTDTSANWSGQTFTNPNVDAISEMKVMLTNYTAEYGIRSGGTINVSIKNGTKEFHGSGYYFKRHEKLNANEWNNKSSAPMTPRQRYRYDNFGYTIGGPIIIPGTGFNQSREKLFFFVAMEWLKNVSPSGAQRRYFPTALERQGDFSQTVQATPDLSTPVVFHDPETGQPFPGNVIPPERADAVGKAFLNFYPVGNPTPSLYAGSLYNWTGTWLTENPRNQQIYRIDWNVAPKTLIYSRFVRTSNPTTNPLGLETVEATYPVLGTYQTNRGSNFVTTWIQTFSTSLVNELTAGFNRGSVEQTPFEDQLEAIKRTNI
ncbi:MAG: hypothetical protein H6Q04_1313, partial [Acidobacteria bacterium]|nr:hypothetical protein [Acidobacteriota bacterium]